MANLETTEVKEAKVKKNPFGFIKKINFKSKKVIAIILVIVIAVSLLVFRGLKKDGKKDGELRTAVAAKGIVSKVVEGSGTIEAIDQYEVTALAIKGEVVECTFEEGDTVEKGQVLYKIDASDMEKNITSSKNALEKAELSYKDTVKDYNDTKNHEKVTAPVSGVITTLSVKKGDKVNNGAAVAVIKNSDEMILKINFNENDANNMYVGQSSDVTLEKSFSKVSGTVTRIGTGSMVTREGARVKAVEITIKNPGAVKENDKATATVGNYACNSSGTFTYSEDETVTAKISGDVYNLNYKEGDYIKKGALIFNIDSDYKDSTLTNSRLAVSDARENLSKMYDDLDEYTITAPISGEIIQKNIKQGEKIDNSNSNEALAIIADLSTLVFDMSIDELDISNIKVGQEVSITADAYEDEEFTGYVDKISIVGKSEQGVTSYPVTVVVDSDNKDKLIPGMNVSASIIIEEKENVLVVPVSAVRRGNIVIAKTDSAGVGEPNMKVKEGEDASGNAPNTSAKTDKTVPGGNVPDSTKKDILAGTDKKTSDKSSKSGEEDNPFLRNLDIPAGYKAIFVETGLSDDDFIEIKAGLNEGDTVVLPDVTTSETSIFGGMQGGPGGGDMQGGPGGGDVQEGPGGSMQVSPGRGAVVRGPRE